LNLSLLSYGSTRCRFNLAITERFERNTSPHELLLKNLIHIAQFGFILGCKYELRLFQIDVCRASFEVESLANFLYGLIDRVRNFCSIDF
jgi:hypothetical protein